MRTTLDSCVTITVLHDKGEAHLVGTRQERLAGTPVNYYYYYHDKHIVGNCDLLPLGMATPPHE